MKKKTKYKNYHGKAYRATDFRMSFDVFGEMIGSHEFFRALRALKPFFSSVGSSVSLKFVGPREFFAAKNPTADKRSFSSVPSEMSSEMTSFAINFITSGNVTNVLSLATEIAITIAFAAIGAGTGDATTMLFTRVGFATGTGCRG